MIGGKTPAIQRPTALGTLVNAATYGLAIPTVFGTTQISILPIWAANLRQGSCRGKKGKGKKKKSPPQYVENIDCLIGSNPIEGILQTWNNGKKYPLNFIRYVAGDPNHGHPGTVTIPDPYFYAVIAVTIEYEQAGHFQDYGSNAPPIYYDITSEYPLWNAVQHGPDILDCGASRWYPWVYKWAPGDGNVVTMPFGNSGSITIYYAQLSTITKHQTPLVELCLTFEPVLGDGPEFTGNFSGTSTPLATQKILYPPYAGVGSPNIDLGSSGAIPLIKLEAMGSFKRWHPRGDADFADMIEDTIKSGMLQVGSQLGLIHRGVNLNSLPGPVQTGWTQYNFSNPLTDLTFYQPNTRGNQLIGIIQYETGSDVPTISDSAGDIWAPVIDSGSRAVFTATSVGSPAGNLVSFNNADGGIRAAFILELDQGSTVLDNTKVFSGASSTDMVGSIQVTGAPTYVLAILFAGELPAIPTHWTDVFPSGAGPSGDFGNPGFGSPSNIVGVWSRIVTTPGLVTFKAKHTASSWTLVLLAYKAAQPVPYPKALGNIIDRPSLMTVRAQCAANGLIGSVNMNSQKPAADWLKEFYECANAWPVWSGFRLKSIARSEVSAVGNGVVYTSPTSSGPVATLTEDDLVGDNTKPLITVKHSAPVSVEKELFNIIQGQFFDRGADYNPSTASEPLSGALALYGPRKKDPTDFPEIQDPAVMRMILAIQANRHNLIDNTSYAFTAQAKWVALEAGDLILVNDSKIGISNLPVRLTKVTENDQYDLEMEAEPFLYGANSPTTLPVTAVAPFTPGDGGDPGSVNTPIIFEAVPRLSGQGNQAQIWLVVSAPSQNYGGCSVLLSTDGGSSYIAVGTIQDSAVTGVTVNDWPAANDPDTADDLQVDLTESLGELDTYSATDRDNFVPLFYVAGGTTCIPYELGSYDIATLTAANKYTLPATGGGPNELRRGVFGAPGPTVGVGVDHPAGSRFAFLNPLGFGIFKLNMDPRWIGKTLYFKFLAVNQIGDNMQDQSDATAYSYTPNGCPAQTQNPNSNDYVNTPAVSLSQTMATNVAMAQTSVKFPSNKVNYNARNFTIPDPGGTPTVYYVTIYDPAQLGDTGSGTTCPSYCETSNAKVGQPGYTYMGFIQATHSITDPLNAAGPGGWPPPQSFLVAP